MVSKEGAFKGIIKFVKTWYLWGAFVCITYFIWKNSDLMVSLAANANMLFLAMSTIIWALLHCLAPLSTRIIFSAMKTKVPYNTLAHIYMSKLPARYLPGGIWHTVGRLTNYAQMGIAKRKISILFLVDTATPCLIPFLLGGGYLWLQNTHPSISKIEGALALVSGCMILILPLLVKIRLSSFFCPDFIKHYISLVFLSVFYVSLASVSFLFYVFSVSIEGLQATSPEIAASYIFSWGVGYISFFAPQGIGVFEVVAGKLMALPLSLDGSVVFLAGFRIVSFLADALIFTIFSLIKFISTRPGVETQ